MLVINTFHKLFYYFEHFLFLVLNSDEMARKIREGKIDRFLLYKYFCEEWSSEVLEKKWIETLKSILDTK